MSPARVARWLAACLFLAMSMPLAAAQPQRVVSLGGVVTEIVDALGAADRLVGVDQSSLHPEAVTRLPQVGYYRNFSVEGVASLKPDLVLASDYAGPPQALEQLRRLGLRVVVVPSRPDVPALFERIERTAEALGTPARGRQLVESLRPRLVQAAPDGPPRRVLLLSSHTGRLQAAGQGTAADAMLRLAGGVNVFAQQQSYKPVSGEAVAALQPDVIVTTHASIEAAGSLAAFRAQPGVALTPAARSGRIVVMDDLLLLGFGPRLPQALDQLREALAER